MTFCNITIIINKTKKRNVDFFDYLIPVTQLSIVYDVRVGETSF